MAAAGPTGLSARLATISVNEMQPEGRGLCGQAIRSQRPCIINDYLADPNAEAFHHRARLDGTNSGASFPLLVQGQVVGAMSFMSLEKDTFTPEFAELLQRLVDNVSFALENFDHADDKARTEVQKERLTRMLAALSSTNEAIIRATSRAELFELVCEAAAKGGKFTSTSIMLMKPDDDFLDVVAAAGPTAASALQVRVSASVMRPEGHGLSGRAIRSRQACIANDYLADSSVKAFHDRARSDGANSGGAFPLFAQGRVVGVMIFISLEKETFTPEFAELLQRLVDNVSFALENFDRVDEKARADERIEYLASHDSLTHLPNREMFNGMLRRAIDAAARYQRQFALLFIDLDRFKVINDSLGHDAGDMLLVEIGGRLRRALRSSDVVARLGGDEFVVILEEAAERPEVERIAGDLLSVLSQPLQLSGHECHTTASIGIAMYPSDGTDIQTLTKNADMAMYLAKEDGKNGFRFFTKEFKTQSIERLKLESALRRALERDQFTLHYQPKIDMASGQITGVEALLRWNHPELGTVSPGQFIPLAEETGLIVPIGRWVLKEACAQNMAWQRRGLRPVTMAVNLSPRQFADPHLLHDVDEALVASGMSAVLLQLEVTESMVMRNVSRAIKVLDAIQSRGIRLAIDDFGTGYSSMSLMKQFPIDTIKIDRSFVRDLPVDSEDQAIAQAIISMGKALGMTVIAEGVETPGAGGIPAQPRLRRNAGFSVFQTAARKTDGRPASRRTAARLAAIAAGSRVRAERRCRLTAADADRGPLDPELRLCPGSRKPKAQPSGLRKCPGRCPRRKHKSRRPAIRVGRTTRRGAAGRRRATLSRIPTTTLAPASGPVQEPPATYCIRRSCVQVAVPRPGAFHLLTSDDIGIYSQRNARQPVIAGHAASARSRQCPICSDGRADRRGRPTTSE